MSHVRAWLVRLRWWVLRLVERIIGRFYEGPTVPKRLTQAVGYFAATHPSATVGEWVAFSDGHAAEAYRSGYVRGLEHARRDKMSASVRQWFEDHEEARHNWSWTDLVPSEEQRRLIVAAHADAYSGLPPEQRVLMQDLIGRTIHERYRVVVVPGTGTKER